MSKLYWDGGQPAAGQKVLLATTAYESPDVSYTFSLNDARLTLESAGIQTAYCLLSGNCHVDDARNTVVKEFLGSDCTDLVFIDADVSFEAEDLVKLCGFDVDLVGGVYPWRRWDGERVASMPVRLLQGAEPRDDGLIEVEGLPTGFMRIRRSVLKRMADNAPSFFKSTDPNGAIPYLFDRSKPGDDEKSFQRWGGDLRFCKVWRDLYGGQCFAYPEFRLGHTSKVVIRDSMAAAQRRLNGQTLRWACDRIKDRTESPTDFEEVFDYVENKFAAPPSLLAACVAIGRKCDGPVIETGSGVSTALLAATNSDRSVFCLEHDAIYAEKMRRMAYEAGLNNIGMSHVGLKDGFYDLSDELHPHDFGLALVDGPPRVIGDRFKFFDILGDRCRVIMVDDMDDPTYSQKVLEWAESRDRGVEWPTTRYAILKPPHVH